jgi:hypothetical protein
MELHWFLTTSPVNFSRHKHTLIDELYAKQSLATDPEERRRLLRAFEKRLYDDEVQSPPAISCTSSSIRCGSASERSV